MADHRHHHRHERERDRGERHRYSASPRRERTRRRRDSERSLEESRERRRSRSPHSRRDSRERRHSTGDDRHSRHHHHHHHREHRHSQVEKERGEPREREREGERRNSDGLPDEARLERQPDGSDTASNRRRGHVKERGGRWQPKEEEEEDVSQYQFGGSAAGDDDTGDTEGGGSSKDKLKPDYGRSGKLTAETNTFKGEVIKYSEPPEARQPKTRWRLYQFKGDEMINVLYIHRQSAYLIGRDRKIVDFPVDHPSCSKQHAVLQYRLVDYVKNDGSKGRRVRLYVIDLESTNGTYLNNNRLEPSRYYELKEKDMIKFGFSSREYVLLHENSRTSDDEED